MTSNHTLNRAFTSGTTPFFFLRNQTRDLHSTKSFLKFPLYSIVLINNRTKESIVISHLNLSTKFLIRVSYKNTCTGTP